MTGTIWFQALPPFLGDPSSLNCVPQVCDRPPGTTWYQNQGAVCLAAAARPWPLSRELGGHRRTFVGGLAERDFLWPQAHLLPETEVLMDRAVPNQGNRELPTGRGLGSDAPGWYFPVGIPQLTWRTSLLTQLQIWSPVLWGGPRMYVCNKSPRPPRSRWPMDWHWRL